MKKVLLIILLFCIGVSFYANEKIDRSGFYLGIGGAGGGRYDEVRSCVASPAGFKGGPAFEFAALAFEYRFNSLFGFGGYIPVARPALFGAAFGMLQFLPEAVFSFHIPITEIVEVPLEIGTGASFHYGPDYNNEGLFFAAGPRVSLFWGMEFYLKNNIVLKTGLRPYFEYLISDYLSGKVIGAEIDFQFRYLFKNK